MLTLVDAFTGTAALGAEGPAALTRALGGGRAPIASAPLGDLHDRQRRRRLVDALVSAFADDSVLVALKDARLADLVPGASLLPDEEIGAHRCGARLSGLLARQRAGRWSTLLELRIGDIGAWNDAGPQTTAELVGLAFERSLTGLASVEPETAPAGVAVDLAILLDHERLGSAQPLFDALIGLSRADRPDVRAAADRLLRA
ncbi:MAG TPA: hypothetical protein VKD67_12145, partial [Acidimicrobiales bacterium]|nr:hypothetical protein [Acidimicrobiales bacterium]